MLTTDKMPVARISTVILVRQLAYGPILAMNMREVASPSCLVELESKNVVVVGQSEHELHNELPRSYHNRTAAIGRGVLPSNTVVVLVDTHYVFCNRGYALGSYQHGV